MDAGNKQIDRLPFDVETLANRAAAPFHEHGIIGGGAVARDDMDLAIPSESFLDEIHVLDDPHIHRRNFTGMMAPKNVIDFIESGQVVLS